MSRPKLFGLSANIKVARVTLVLPYLSPQVLHIVMQCYPKHDKDHVWRVVKESKTTVIFAMG